MNRIIKIADEFAKKANIDSLPLSYEKLEQIVADENCKIIYYSKAYKFLKAMGFDDYLTTSKGFTYFSDDNTIIFIKDELEYLDKINVICHELGHVVLKHIYVGSKQKSISDISDNPLQNKNIQETEADVFALVIQAPTYMLKILDISSSSGLVERGIFTKENAKLRMKYYRKAKKSYKAFLWTVPIFFAVLTIIILSGSYAERANNSNRLDVQPSMKYSETTTEVVSEYVLQNDSGTVFITKSGIKYHKSDCFHIKNKDVIEISTEKAVELSYQPCSDCFGKDN